MAWVNRSWEGTCRCKVRGPACACMRLRLPSAVVPVLALRLKCACGQQRCFCLAHCGCLGARLPGCLQRLLHRMPHCCRAVCSAAGGRAGRSAAASAAASQAAALLAHAAAAAADASAAAMRALALAGVMSAGTGGHTRGGGRGVGAGAAVPSLGRGLDLSRFDLRFFLAARSARILPISLFISAMRRLFRAMYAQSSSVSRLAHQLGPPRNARMAVSTDLPYICSRGGGQGSRGLEGAASGGRRAGGRWLGMHRRARSLSERLHVLLRLTW